MIMHSHTAQKVNQGVFIHFFWADQWWCFIFHLCYVFLCTKYSVRAGYFETSSRSDTGLNFRHHKNPKDRRHPEELENDCSMAKQRCQEDPYCSVVYKSFQRACQVGMAKCRLPIVNQMCLSAWKELRKTVLGECKCSEPLQMRCIETWKEMFDNPCLQYSQESQASAASESYSDDDEEEEDAYTGWSYSSSLNAFLHINTYISIVCRSLWKRFS